MARVSIEERAAAGAKKLARTMGWKKSETIGRLYFMWHDSQELEQVTCTVDDLSLWMELTAAEESKIVDAMIEAGFLERGDGAALQITGNEKHIENLRFKRDQARENGKLGGRPRKPPETNVGYLDKPTSQTKPNQYENPSSLQFSAVQFSAEKKDSVSIARVERLGDGEVAATVLATNHAPPEPQDPDKALSQENIAACEKAWVETLGKFEVGRSLVLPHEKMAIAEAIKRLGFKTTVYALTGYRFEPSTPTYDPKKHIKIQRVFAHDLFEKWVNLACQENEKWRKKAGAA